MRLIALVTLVIFSSTLTGCTGDTTSENIEDTTSEIESDNAQFEAKQEQRFAEKLLENELAKERLSAQKEIADDKLDVARQRLRQQAELKLLDMQNRGSS